MILYDLFNGNVLLQSYASYKDAFEAMVELQNANRIGNFKIQSHKIIKGDYYE